MAAILRHSGAPATALIAIAVLLSPLPFGSATPAAQTALALACSLSLAVACAFVRRFGALRDCAGPCLALTLLALLGLLQLAPLPTSIAKLLSPEHALLTTEAHSAVTGVQEPPSTTRLTLAPAITRKTALWFLTVAMAMAATTLAAQRRRERRWLVCALLLATLFELFYGTRQWLWQSRTIWGREVPGVDARLRGTFVNPNHLAGYLLLPLALLFAWTWWSLRRHSQGLPIEQRVFGIAVPVILWLATFLGLAFTASRAGLAAAGASTVAMGLLAAFVVEPRGRARRSRSSRSALLGAVILGIGIAIVAGVSVQRGLGRILATAPSELLWGARAQVCVQTLELWQRYPLLGSGLGSFREALETQQPASLPGRWDHAHNDFLELGATAGLLGIVVAAIGLTLLVRRLLVVLRRGYRTEDNAFALAGLGIVVGVGVHELLDFGLTMPSNAFTAAALLAAALTARTEDPGDNPVEAEDDDPNETPARAEAVHVVLPSAPSNEPPPTVGPHSAVPR